EFHREIYNSIKEFDVDHLFFGFRNRCSAILKEMMADSSFVLDLSRCCKSLDLNDTATVTPECIYQVYKILMERSWKLRRINIDELS
ncbi:hypothetical protein PENTCL1PPCAC_19252, partial [Pristionchus entomophagus]